MFKCQVTGNLSEIGEKLNKIVTKSRERTYVRDERDPDTGRWSEVTEGVGWEIVEEIDASAEGVRIWNAMGDLERDELVSALKQSLS